MADRFDQYTALQILEAEAKLRSLRDAAAAIVVRTGMVYLSDPGVAEPGENLRLILETAHCRSGRDAVLHKLDRHGAPRLLLHRAIHHAHSTPGQHALDMEVPNLLGEPPARGFRAGFRVRLLGRVAARISSAAFIDHDDRIPGCTPADLSVAQKVPGFRSATEAPEYSSMPTPRIVGSVYRPIHVPVVDSTLRSGPIRTSRPGASLREASESPALRVQARKR